MRSGEWSRTAKICILAISADVAKMCTCNRTLEPSHSDTGTFTLARMHLTSWITRVLKKNSYPAADAKVLFAKATLYAGCVDD